MTAPLNVGCFSGRLLVFGSWPSWTCLGHPCWAFQRLNGTEWVPWCGHGRRCPGAVGEEGPVQGAKVLAERLRGSRGSQLGGGGVHRARVEPAEPWCFRVQDFQHHKGFAQRLLRSTKKSLFGDLYTLLEVWNALEQPFFLLLRGRSHDLAHKKLRFVGPTTA